MMTNDKDEKRVHLHLTISPTARRALRLAAASYGRSMAELVEHWAVAEAQSMGLVGNDRGGAR